MTLIGAWFLGLVCGLISAGIVGAVFIASIALIEGADDGTS